MLERLHRLLERERAGSLGLEGGLEPLGLRVALELLCLEELLGLRKLLLDLRPVMLPDWVAAEHASLGDVRAGHSLEHVAQNDIGRRGGGGLVGRRRSVCCRRSRRPLRPRSLRLPLEPAELIA